MQKTLEQQGLTFGREFIAKNLNRYRMATPTPEFWDYYKEHKEDLKSAGFSVYKHTELGFMVYDWRSKEKATQADFDAQEKEREEYEKHRLQCAIDLLRADVDERAAKDETVGDITTWNEFHEEMARLYDNPDYTWREYYAVNLPENFYKQK
jgi:hypothetical protein